MAEDKTDIEQLRGILEQFDQDTILEALKEYVPTKFEPTIPTQYELGNVITPLVLFYPGGLAFGSGLFASTKSGGGCSPSSSDGVEWGDWKDNRGRARSSGRRAALNAAKGGCSNDSCVSGGIRGHCEYREVSTTYKDDKERTRRGKKEYKYKYKSEGNCVCSSS